MKILHICTFQKYGGAAMAARRLIEAMRGNGMDIHLLVQRPEFTEPHVSTVADTWFSKYYNYVLFAIDRLYFWFFEKNKSVRFAFSPAVIGNAVHHRTEVKDADILHLHWTSFGFMSVEELAKLNKPIVWTLHDMWLFTGGCHYSGDCLNFENQCGNCVKYLRNPASKDLSHRVWLRKREVFGHINQVIVAPSKWLADLAKKSSLLQDTPIHVIPYTINTEVFKPVSKAIARQQNNLPINTTLILFAAAKISDERKGLTYFLESLRLLKNRSEKNIELVIMGGNVPAEIIASCPYKIHTTGHLSNTEQIASVYAAADIFVISSLEDNLPNTVIESLSCGTPVVGFNTGGVGEMIDHLKNGYVAKYKSSEDLANGMDWIMSHQNQDLLSMNARQKVEQTYAPTIIAQQYKNIYESLLKTST